jgi:hypothetical protein
MRNWWRNVEAESAPSIHAITLEVARLLGHTLKTDDSRITAAGSRNRRPNLAAQETASARAARTPRHRGRQTGTDQSRWGRFHRPTSRTAAR